MARDPIVTRDAVFMAADDIARRGDRVSVNSVRDYIGGGSGALIHDLLVEWQQQRRASGSAGAGSHGFGGSGGGGSEGSRRLPGDIRAVLDQFNNQIQRQWLEAMSLRLEANDQVAVIRAAAEARVREADDRARELEQKLRVTGDRLSLAEQERDALATALEAVHDRFTLFGADANTLPRAPQPSDASRQQIEALQTERDSLRMELTAARQELALRRQAAEMLDRQPDLREQAARAGEAASAPEKADFADGFAEEDWMAAQAARSQALSPPGAPDHDTEPSTGLSAGPSFDKAPFDKAPLDKAVLPSLPEPAQDDDVEAIDPEAFFGSPDASMASEDRPRRREPSLPDGSAVRPLPPGSGLQVSLDDLLPEEDEATKSSSGSGSGSGSTARLPQANARDLAGVAEELERIFSEDALDDLDDLDEEGLSLPSPSPGTPGKADSAGRDNDTSGNAAPSALRQRLETAQQSLAREKERADEAERSLAALRKERDRLQQTESRLEAEKHALQQERDTLANKVTEQQAWITKARARMDKAGLLKNSKQQQQRRR